MKIAFVGKGGSGKTTVSSQLARSAAKNGTKVLAIDADINQRFAETLGLSAEQAKLVGEVGKQMLDLKAYVKGQNTLLPEADKIAKTTPAGTGSTLILPFTDPYLQSLVYHYEGIDVLKTGGFEEEDLGVKCYHAKTGAIELLLNHLADADDELVLVDMTAGADAFASGLFAKFDATFVVVEPTEASVSVWKQYQEYAMIFDIRLELIANKCMDEADIAYITESCGTVPCAVIPFSKAIRQLDRGMRDDGALAAELGTSIAHVLALLPTITPDRKRFQELAIYFHYKNAAAGGGLRLGSDLTTHVDEAFDFESAVNKLLK
jgi:CO dehydrogenase maturation factor